MNRWAFQASCGVRGNMRESVVGCSEGREPHQSRMMRFTKAHRILGLGANRRVVDRSIVDRGCTLVMRYTDEHFTCAGCA